MNKNLSIGLVVVALVLGVYNTLTTPSEVTKTIIQKESVGAASGPILPYPYFGFGGVVRYAGSTSLNQASTTLCAIQSPAATSTLISGNVILTTGTTTAISLEVAKSSNPSATTTRLGYQVLASNAQVTLAAVTSSTTATGGSSGSTFTVEPDYIFAPNTYFTAKYGGAAGSANVLVGRCNATFEATL